MTRALRTGAAAALVAALVVSSAAAQTADLVTPQDGTTYELLPVPSSTVAVPLDVATGVDAAAVTVELLRVRLGNTQNAVAEGAFVARYVPDPPAIFVDVSTDDAPEAGTYELSLRVAHADQVQRLELQLERKAAVLEAPATVTVERTRGLRFWEVHEELPSVKLIERAGQRVSDVVARQIDTARGGVAVGRPPLLDGTRLTAEIEPKGDVALRYEIEDVGDGTESRTVEVLAPQLSQPVKIAFSIETRWHWGWIVFWAAIGLLAGWAVRTGGERFAEVRRQRLVALRLVQSLGEERLRHLDDAFRRKLDEQLEGLHDLRSDTSRWRSAEEIKKATDDVPAALRLALEDLAGRRTALVARLDALRDLRRSSWNLPGRVSSALDAAGTVLAAAEKRLRVDDVGDPERGSPPGSASAIVESARRDLVATLRGEAELWEGAALDALSRLRRSSPGSEHPLHVQASASRDALLELRACTRSEKPDPTTYVQKLDSVYEALLDFRAVLPALVEAVGEAAGLLPKERAQELRQPLDRVRQALGSLDGGTDDGVLRALPADAAALVESARRAIVQTAPESRRADVGALADALDFVAAARQATAARGQILGEGDEPAAREPTAPPGRERAPRSFYRSSTRVLGGPVLLPVALEIRRARRQIAVAHLARTLFAGAIFLLVAIPLFKDDFVGGFDDAMGIVLWAFATDFAVDFSIDRVVALARTAAPAPSEAGDVVAVEAEVAAAAGDEPVPPERASADGEDTEPPDLPDEATAGPPTGQESGNAAESGREEPSSDVPSR